MTRAALIVRLRYNVRVPRRTCTSRAEWRLQPGKPAEQLSPHYRLDCDYGTGVITCWEDGGSEPIYVCEIHAKQLGRPRKIVTDIRVITQAADNENSSIRVQEQIEIQEPISPAPEAPALPEAAAVIPETPKMIEAPAATAEAAAEMRPAQETDVRTPGAKPPVAPEAAPKPSRTKTGRASEAPARSPARDLTFGNPAKAIVDEAIWNMPAGNYQAYKGALEQGKSPAEAAEAAGGQMAMIHRKIGDYSLRLENFLSASRGKVSVSETIDKPLEQAVLEIISGPTSDSEKDAAVQQLGSLQEGVKSGAQGDISLLQANRILLAIGDRMNWGGPAAIPEEFKPLYRTLFDNLRNAICKGAPETQSLHDRLMNLHAAKSDLNASR
ncbi:MAG TPA: hypothetical protein VHX36_13480 [Candidatus Acidoferrales bacterium]|jgi:hypothetical protein|nr:hypothetical protein [Candidatus Acidoferrales bacterium]